MKRCILLRDCGFGSSFWYFTWNRREGGAQYSELSDSFEYAGTQKEEPNLELKVLVLYINQGNNKELLEVRRTLREYMIFVDRIPPLHENHGVRRGGRTGGRRMHP